MPIAVVIVSLIVAVAAVSALIYVLFRNTTGPGQTLRKYYEAVAAGDCDTAFDYLSMPLREKTGRTAFCDGVQALSRADRVPTDVTIRVVTGYGEPPARFARVVVRERGPGAFPRPVRWRMLREGESWRVASFDTTRCAAKLGAIGCAPPLG